MTRLLLALAVLLAFLAGWLWRSEPFAAVMLLLTTGVLVLTAHVAHLLARKWRSPLLTDVGHGKTGT